MLYIPTLDFLLSWGPFIDYVGPYINDEKDIRVRAKMISSAMFFFFFSLTVVTLYLLSLIISNLRSNNV